VRVGGVDVELDRHALQERHGTALTRKIGRHIEHQAVVPGFQGRAASQVGDSTVTIGFGHRQLLLTAI
jgi:hypothetical protein